MIMNRQDARTPGAPGNEKNKTFAIRIFFVFPGVLAVEKMIVYGI
jgi:hypothetical protein